MRFADIIVLSTRSFKTRPMRTFLTVLGVSVGIGTVLFLVSLGYGLQNIILNKITTADALLSLDISAGSSGLISLNKETIDAIEKIPEVDEISPVVNLSAQLTMDEFTGDGLVFAAKPSYFRLGGVIPQYGEVFTSENSNEIVISSAGVQLFNLEPEQILGKKIELTLFVPKISEDGFEEIDVVRREEQYEIIGVVEDDNTNFIFLPLEKINDLSIDSYAQLKVKVKNDEVMEKVRGEIINLGFLVSSLSDTIAQAKKIFKIIQTVLALFGFVALLVSAIGMVNTMTIALLERINEIGIMRSIGASRGNIQSIFLIESLLMGFMGGIGGVIIGYLGGELANIGINILANNFGGQSLDLFYRPLWFIAVIVASSTLVGLLTGIYPSRRASKLNPLEALRYK